MLISLIVNFVPIIIAIILHEVAHGYAAYKLGDNTAKINGRLSLNPLKHVDPFGTILLPAMLIFAKAGFIFGWAKPVPVNFSNLHHPRRDLLIVASAGMVTNIFLALISTVLLHLSSLIPNLYLQGILGLFFVNMVAFNIVLAVFNALPIPPLDGSKILFGWMNNRYAQNYVNAERNGSIFVILIIFIVPMIARYLGFDFNPFGSYLIKTSKFFISILL